METVQMNNFHDKCVGVTDLSGQHHKLNDRGEVTLDSATAQAFRENKIVRNPRRSFGGFTLPKPAAD